MKQKQHGILHAEILKKILKFARIVSGADQEPFGFDVDAERYEIRILLAEYDRLTRQIEKEEAEQQ